jgi:hypothetical protein
LPLKGLHICLMNPRHFPPTKRYISQSTQSSTQCHAIYNLQSLETTRVVCRCQQENTVELQHLSFLGALIYHSRLQFCFQRKGFTHFNGQRTCTRQLMIPTTRGELKYHTLHLKRDSTIPARGVLRGDPIAIPSGKIPICRVVVRCL